MGSKRPYKEEEEEDSDRCPNFAVNGFYGTSRPSLKGSNMREKVLRISKGAQHMEQRPLPCEYNPGVLGPPATWKTFFRQLEAIKYSQLLGEGLMVFSFEGEAVGSKGKRNYVVSHPRQMWLRLIGRPPSKRCSYEVIQEGSVCKLYFDLEFSFLYNNGKDGNTMTETFIKIVCHFIQKEFGILCMKNNIVDLCSSTFLKFSRHLIFNMPNTAFANNIHVGRFVVMICNKIREWHCKYSDEVSGVSIEDVEYLFVADSKTGTSLFCDEGVYNKNRNFRVLHSTKLGKNTPLIVSSKNRYMPVPKNGLSKDEQLFIDSLITTVEGGCRVLTFGENYDKVHRVDSHNKKVDDMSSMDGNNISPYPEIDQYIQSLVQPGSIRCWFYFPQSELLVYEIAQNRYCHNINREHKSNGIMYVVNLKMGTFYQKCHDPDCKDFRSDIWQLPENTLFWKHMGEDEMMDLVLLRDDFNDSADEMLVTAVDKAEAEEMALSDEELCTLAGKLEMWDNLDALSSRSCSLPGSQGSSQCASQKSNPWDKLSQLSTPDSSYFASLSQMSDVNNETLTNNGHFERLVSSSSSSKESNEREIDSDEELAIEASRMEQEIYGSDVNTHNAEIEFKSSDY